MNGQVGIEDTVLVSGEIDVRLKPRVCYFAQVFRVPGCEGGPCMAESEF